MASFKINVKPTSGGDKLILDVEETMTIAELKEALTALSSIPVEEQRLIYKGQVLKNERTVESYGIQAEHVLHMVRSKPPATSNSGGGTAVPTSAAAQTPTMFGLGAQPQGTEQQQLISNLMSMPQVQSVLQNPEVLRSMLNANPAIRQLMNSNPEMAHILNNPQLLRESLNLAANPSLLREQMRHSDRAMSNLEAHPEGFNALRRMYENIQEPLQNATTGENGAAANPFASLFESQPGAQAGQAAPAQATTEATAPGDGGPAGTAPNTAPLPNPWAPNSGSGATAAGGGGATGALPPGLGGTGLGGLPGLGGTGGAGALGSPQVREALLQQLQDPAYRQAMTDFMGSEAGQQAFRSLAASNPQLQQAMDGNPMMRNLFNDPEQLRRLLAPESVSTMIQMTQAAEQMQRALGLGSTGEQPGGLGQMGLGQNNADVTSLLQMLGGGDAAGLGGLSGFGGTAPVANPEEAFAAQLTQLQEMGFPDRQSNIQALQQTGGNVQAAVERLLNGA